MPNTGSSGDMTRENLQNLSTLPSGLWIPKGIKDVDAQFMTRLLRYRGVISETNEVISQVDSDVGMTAGYFSEIKKVKCQYKEKTDAPDAFVVKTWPEFELLPKEHIFTMFLRDINSYMFPKDKFFPRPKAYLGAYETESYHCALIMEDVETYAVHKVHEHEMTFQEVMLMIPRLVDMAVNWEGCHEGEKATELEKIGVFLWTSDLNINTMKAIMPAGAKLLDKLLSTKESNLLGGMPWDICFGKEGFSERLTRKVVAFYESMKPENGATCTLSHGDLRGDNIFLYNDDWLCIDFQLMFRGPVPSDLAYLMTSASVLPDAYTGNHLETILRTFYDQFMEKTTLYKNYTYESFEHEFRVMSTVLFYYYVGFGGAIVREGAFNNAQASRIELGGQGVVEADLTPEERRQRMWWRKSYANFREIFLRFNLYQYLNTLQDTEGLGDWVELPDHLK